MSGRAGVWLIAFGAAVAAVYVLLPAGLAQGISFEAVGVFAAVAVLLGVVHHRPDNAAAWGLLGAGLLLAVLGDGLEVGDGVRPPGASPLDIPYLGGYACLFTATVMIVNRRSHERNRDALIDGAIFAVAAAVLAWDYLIAPNLEGTGISWHARAIALGYPIADILLLALITRIAFQSGNRTPSFWLLLSGLVTLLTGDLVYAALHQSGAYHSGHPLDAAWLASKILIGAAALHPSMTRVFTPRPPRNETIGLPRVVLIGVGLLVVPVSVLLHSLSDERINGFILAVAPALLAALVVARVIGLVTEKEHAQEALRRREERFRSLVQNSSDMILLVDANLAVRYGTPSLERVLGYVPADLIGRRITELLHPEDAEHVARFFERAATQPETPDPVEWRMCRPDGSWAQLETVATNRVLDPAVGGFVLNSRDIGDRKALEDQLRYQAFHDGLTGLANRALFADRVGHAVARREGPGRMLAVMFVDLDDFKTVNDSLGHAVGDELLVHVAGRIRECLRPEDTAARLGGDEFAVLIEDLADDAEASDIAGRLVEVLEQPLHIGQSEVSVRASIGVVIEMSGVAEADMLLRNADVAMYTAKNRGKGRFEIFQPAMQAAVHERMELKADLSHAIEREELDLAFQPLLALDSERIIGLEALIRWDHPRRGTLAPLSFIPLAEETGQIVTIGRWVLAEACVAASQWIARHPHRRPLGLSVNLSAVQLQYAGLVKDVADALRRSGFPARDLILEITESAIMRDLDAASATLSALKRLGVQIAIDDFGTGYSSLGYLQRLPVDILKIDRSFVETMTASREGAALTTAIVELGRTLQLQTVAEGIETQEQLSRLQAIGCRVGQGYYLGRPMGRDAVDALLAETDRRRSAVGSRLVPRAT